MKILMLIDLLKAGGTEKHILSLSRFLRAEGIQVGIASNGGPLTAVARKMGIPVHKFPLPNMKRNASDLYGIVTKNKYNIVHMHIKFRYAEHFLRKYPQIPLLATTHGTYHNGPDRKVLAKSFKKIVAVSPRLSQWLVRKGVPAYKISYIPNGISTTQFREDSNQQRWRKVLGLPQDAILLVYAGRFARDKYPIARKVILAAETAARSNKKFIAVLYGPGPYRQQLVQLAGKANQRLGRSAILVKGPLSKIQHAYHAADIVVGTGRVALEALACAKPVIAAGVAGYCGIVKPSSMQRMINCNFGDHGAFLPLTIARLTNDLSLILKQPKWRRTLGRYGLKIARKDFSISKVGGRHVELYRQFIKNAY